MGSAIALVYVRNHGTQSLSGLETSILPAAGVRVSLATAFLLCFLLLSGPWALGLLLRIGDQFRQARAEREQAELKQRVRQSSPRCAPSRPGWRVSITT